MPDNKAGAVPLDCSRISLHDEREVAYWTARLQLDRTQLESAIRVVGPDIAAVKIVSRGVV